MPRVSHPRGGGCRAGVIRDARRGHGRGPPLGQDWVDGTVPRTSVVTQMDESISNGEQPSTDSGMREPSQPNIASLPRRSASLEAADVIAPRADDCDWDHSVEGNGTLPPRSILLDGIDTTIIDDSNCVPKTVGDTSASTRHSMAVRRSQAVSRRRSVVDPRGRTPPLTAWNWTQAPPGRRH